MTSDTGIPDPRPGHPDVYWRTMHYFSLYRLIIACILFSTYFLTQGRDWWERYDSALYFGVALGYLGFGGLTAVLAGWRWPHFNRQLTIQAVGDISFIVMLMYASGGVKSGLGLLLVVAIAGASLISQGRLALFYAALATIALLLEQSWQLLTWQEHYDDYGHAVMLGLSCFVTAWLAHTFAQRTRQSEELASRRGVDLQNLSQVNQLVIQDMQDGVLVVDQDLRVKQHNLRAETLLGIRPSDWREAELDRLAPDIARLHEDWVVTDQENPRGAPRLTVEGRELCLRFLPVGNDRRQGAVIFIEDWSRVQAQARQLKLAALGRLTANVAHEIRNPLSAISHASQLLQEEDNLGATPRRLLQIVDDNVQRLDNMVQDVMQLSRRDRIRQEVVNLDAFLQEFRVQYCQVENIAPDGFLLEPVDPAINVLFDRNHLHQVLWNLCRNGWRHGCKHQGSLVMQVGEGVRRSEVEVEIADDGPGVPKDVRPHLFEPFFTTEAAGTGLGLYVARELCEANGAGLNYVESPIGAHFKIYLKMHYE